MFHRYGTCLPKWRLWTYFPHRRITVAPRLEQQVSDPMSCAPPSQMPGAITFGLARIRHLAFDFVAFQVPKKYHHGLNVERPGPNHSLECWFEELHQTHLSCASCPDWPNRWLKVNGNWVSVWGNVNQLKVLQSLQSLRSAWKESLGLVLRTSHVKGIILPSIVVA